MQMVWAGEFDVAPAFAGRSLSGWLRVITIDEELFVNRFISYFDRVRGRFLALFLSVGALLWGVTGAMAETGVRPDPAAVARGTALYRSHCISCHREGGVGEPRIPWSIRLPDFIEAMPLNESSHAWHHSDEQLVTMILDGSQRSRRRMPVFRNVLTEKDATDVIAYLKTLWSDRILACQGPAHMRCM
jgi:mono/diheme cytochrome c family protein